LQYLVEYRILFGITHSVNLGVYLRDNLRQHLDDCTMIEADWLKDKIHLTLL